MPAPSQPRYLLITIASILLIGILQISSAFYVLNAGNIRHWIGAILGVGTCLDLAVIVSAFTFVQRRARAS